MIKSILAALLFVVYCITITESAICILNGDSANPEVKMNTALIRGIDSTGVVTDSLTLVDTVNKYVSSSIGVGKAGYGNGLLAIPLIKKYVEDNSCTKLYISAHGLTLPKATVGLDGSGSVYIMGMHFGYKNARDKTAFVNAQLLVDALKDITIEIHFHTCACTAVANNKATIGFCYNTVLHPLQLSNDKFAYLQYPWDNDLGTDAPLYLLAACDDVYGTGSNDSLKKCAKDMLTRVKDEWANYKLLKYDSGWSVVTFTQESDLTGVTPAFFEDYEILKSNNDV